MYGKGCLSYRITQYIIQKVPRGLTPKISANTKSGNMRGGTVSVLVTIQNASPATAKPNIAHRDIFITDQPRKNGFVQLFQKLSLSYKSTQHQATPEDPS
jgi:hypothetical protein